MNICDSLVFWARKLDVRVLGVKNKHTKQKSVTRAMTSQLSTISALLAWQQAVSQSVSRWRPWDQELEQVQQDTVKGNYKQFRRHWSIGHSLDNWICAVSYCFMGWFSNDFRPFSDQLKPHLYQQWVHYLTPTTLSSFACRWFLNLLSNQANAARLATLTLFDRRFKNPWLLTRVVGNHFYQNEELTTAMNIYMRDRLTWPENLLSEW